MSNLSEKIRVIYADYAICKDEAAYGLFSGRTLPTFVKDYILNRFTKEGIRDVEGIRQYLSQKMPQNSDNLIMKLLDGEDVNVTTDRKSVV